MILGGNMQIKTFCFCVLLTQLCLAGESAKKIDPLKGLSSKTSASPDQPTERTSDQMKTLPKIQVPPTNNKGFSIEGNQKCAVSQGSVSYSPGQAGYESCVQQMKDNAKTGRDK